VGRLQQPAATVVFLGSSDDVVDAGMYATLVAMAESEQLDIAMV